jgi:hypothetical protein
MFGKNSPLFWCSETGLATEPMIPPQVADCEHKPPFRSERVCASRQTVARNFQRKPLGGNAERADRAEARGSEVEGNGRMILQQNDFESR